MAIVANEKPHSLTHIQNLSFDETNQLAVREIVGVDTNGTVRKVPVNTDGSLKVADDSIPTAGNNPSYVLSYNVAGYCVKIEETIGATTYTTNIVPQDSDTVIVTTKQVSAWS